MLADVKMLDHKIDTIAFDNDVCSSVNAIKVNGICYFPDMDTVSTEMIAGGYPWTDWSGLFMSEWVAVPEIPSFYLNHPKISSGQYMAQVSDSANIGYFSINGKCTDNYYKNGILHCDGYPSVNIRMVEYTSFHRPLLSSPTCSIHSNNTMSCAFSDPAEITVCNHNLDGFNRHCNTTITRELAVAIHAEHGYSVKTPITTYQLQRGKEYCKTCMLTILDEVGHRCLWCLIIIMLASGLGYIALITHLLLTRERSRC